MNNIESGCNVAVNTNIVAIRPEIPETLVSVMSFLKRYGWGISLQTHDLLPGPGRCRVTIHKGTWLNTLVPTYEYHFLSADQSESSIIHTVRRITELALQLEEVFSDTYPSSTVDADGVIRDNPEWLSLSKLGKAAILGSRINQERIDKQESGATLRRGFLELNDKRHHVLLSGSDARQIRNHMYAKLKG